MKRILVVEDEIKLSNIIKDYFEARSFDVSCVQNGIDGLKVISEHEYDIIFLDVMMHYMNGFEFCANVRKKIETPIIFLTAIPDEEFQLKAYNMGANDYVTKPFSLAVLYAKTKVLLQIDDKRKHILIEGDLKINLKSHVTTIKDMEVNLPKKEYDLIVYLINNKGIVKSREEILDALWSDDLNAVERNVDTHIKLLRKKLMNMKDHIVTVLKEGYKWES